MQSMTAPRSRQVSASTPVDIIGEFGAPVQLMQNSGTSDANVTFNGGSVPMVLKVAETIVLQVPVFGTIESDQDIVVLA